MNQALLVILRVLLSMQIIERVVLPRYYVLNANSGQKIKVAKNLPVIVK